MGKGQTKSNDISVLVWNVNGFNAVKSKGSLDKLIADMGEVDFICLNETKVALDKF